MERRQEPVAPVDKSSRSFTIYILAGVVAVITWLAFGPALQNSFINWDDNAYVFENPHLGKALSESIPYFFGPHYFIGNYIPVTMIAYALEFQVNGLDSDLFHTVNVLLHVANVLLVFWFIWLLSGRKPLVATFVALFFGIHPMHVESVAWVAELKDVLYSFFFLAGLIAYYKYTTSKRVNAEQSVTLTMLLGTFILFALSVLSKPAAVVFPLVLLLLDFYTARRHDKWVWLEKAPFFILSLIFGIVAIRSQQADKLLHDYYPFSQRLFFATHSLLQYIVKLFLPINLSIFYPYPKLVSGHLPIFFYVTPVLVLGLFYVVYRTVKYTRIISFGALFFLVNIVLVLQLLSIGDAIMADRYTYIPYIGLLFMLGTGLDWLYNSAHQKAGMWKPVAAGITIVFSIFCTYTTYARCQVWHDDDTIATDLLEKYPDDRLALNNKGFILYSQRRYNEAIPLFKKAIELNPGYIMAYINLMNNYIAMGDLSSAEQVTASALSREPSNHNLLNTRAYLLFRAKNYEAAIKVYNEAIRLKKDNIPAYIYQAECYFALKDYNSQLKVFDTALMYEPDNFNLLNNKGYTLYVMGRYQEAVTYLKAALERKPDFETASVNLANCYKAMSDSGNR